MVTHQYLSILLWLENMTYNANRLISGIVMKLYCSSWPCLGENSYVAQSCCIDFQSKRFFLHACLPTFAPIQPCLPFPSLFTSVPAPFRLFLRAYLLTYPSFLPIPTDRSPYQLSTFTPTYLHTHPRIYQLNLTVLLSYQHFEISTQFSCLHRTVFFTYQFYRLPEVTTER
jgi:hypothetical protein